MQHETAVFSELLVDAIEREQERAREDVLLNKIYARAKLRVARIRAGDKLERDQPAGFEHSATYCGILR